MRGHDERRVWWGNKKKPQLTTGVLGAETPEHFGRRRLLIGGGVPGREGFMGLGGRGAAQ